MKPTKKQFAAIKKRFLKETGIEVVQSIKWYNYFKRRAAENILKLRGVKHAKKFLSERFLLLDIGRRRILFAPRELGKYPVRDLCTLTHEYTHCIQRKRMGAAGYELAYASNHKSRMRIEVEAYASEIPVRGHFGYYRKVRDIFDDDFGRIYMVKPESVEYAKDKYRERELAGFWDARYPASRKMLKIIKEIMQ